MSNLAQFFPRTREQAQEQAEALVAKAKAETTQAQADTQAALDAVTAADAIPDTPVVQSAPIITGPGGDTRVSGQPTVAETLTTVAEQMKKEGH